MLDSMKDARQYEIAMRVRHAQRRIAVGRLWGLAWLQEGEVERVQRAIVRLVLARFNYF